MGTDRNLFIVAIGCYAESRAMDIKQKVLFVDAGTGFAGSADSEWEIFSVLLTSVSIWP